VIPSIHLKNFQAHKDSFIEFCEGFNVITGSSDAGKSSIFRAEEWVRKNRPSGDDVKNWDSKEDDPVVVKIDSVIKQRVKGKSSYKLNGTTFEAIKTDVPEEITKELNLSDINIQTQHDSYFLLTDSPGEVARKLNEIVGLDIIDKIYKNLNSKANSTKRDIQTLDSEITNLHESLECLSYLDEAEKEIEELETLVNEFNSLDARINLAQTIVDSLSKIKEEKNKLTPLINLKSEAEEIISLCGQYNDCAEESEKIGNIVKSLKDVNSSIVSEESWLLVKPLYEEINSLLKELSDCVKSTETALKLLETYQSVTFSINEKERQIKDAKKQYEELLMEHKICPVCNQKITTKIIKEMFS
jgi:DNA repair ATPase RecN